LVLGLSSMYYFITGLWHKCWKQGDTTQWGTETESSHCPCTRQES